MSDEKVSADRIAAAREFADYWREEMRTASLYGSAFTPKFIEAIEHIEALLPPPYEPLALYGVADRRSPFSGHTDECAACQPKDRVLLVICPDGTARCAHRIEQIEAKQ
jgi:hypothetical protein